MIEALCRRDCIHIKEDKNECRLLPDCPIRIPTLMSPEDQRKRNIEKKYVKYDKCLFPKCRSKMRINGYCAFHNEVVTTVESWVGLTKCCTIRLSLTSVKWRVVTTKPTKMCVMRIAKLLETGRERECQKKRCI
jgi:hypothetical protein